MSNNFYSWVIFSNVTYFFFIKLVMDNTYSFPRYNLNICL